MSPNPRMPSTADCPRMRPTLAGARNDGTLNVKNATTAANSRSPPARSRVAAASPARADQGADPIAGDGANTDGVGAIAEESGVMGLGLAAAATREGRVQQDVGACVRGTVFGGDRSAVHDEDAVADAEQFLEVG